MYFKENKIFGSTDHLEKATEETNTETSISKESQKSSFFPFALFVVGTFLTMFFLRNWFPEDRF